MQLPTIRTALALPFAASILMTGCSWFSVFGTFSYARLPVPKAASQPGATQAQVVKAGGNPNSVWMVRDGTGVCYNYILHRGEERRPYYVVFDKRGLVIRRGFATCMDADRKGLLRADTGAAR
ncbi:outer membrane protein assembly factor BamE domain-containing protein [Burkholderia alba]|uniref:outer membrane protein assembly factor BamE domain-containing protein n=1 Tax=Burkholderia alba TaxID=2683677 RepID=UPI002B0594D8|nr:outer membrane protein assembly factor BamE [Burkholderia alba]